MCVVDTEFEVNIVRKSDLEQLAAYSATPRSAGSSSRVTIDIALVVISHRSVLKHVGNILMTGPLADDVASPLIKCCACTAWRAR